MAITCSGIQRVLTAVTIMLFSAALVETQQSTQDAPTTPRTCLLYTSDAADE